MTNTRKLIGSAAFAAALTGGGIAGALLGTPGTSGAQEPATTVLRDDDVTEVHAAHRPAHLEAAAAALDMTAEALKAELETGKTIAEVATEKGVDIERVIDALVADATEDIREHITAMVNGELPFRAHHRAVVKLDAVATAIGITQDELRAALESGQTIAELAAAEGVDAQTVIDALVEAGVPADRAEELVDREGGFRRHHRGHRP